ncbi:MAG: hypothetical protein Q8Q62_13145, partial [Mesorhizobium sp.]|nr:hypothetical protein [Mesorhizobium sp.]
NIKPRATLACQTGRVAQFGARMALVGLRQIVMPRSPQIGAVQRLLVLRATEAGASALLRGGPSAVAKTASLPPAHPVSARLSPPAAAALIADPALSPAAPASSPSGSSSGILQAYAEGSGQREDTPDASPFGRSSAASTPPAETAPAPRALADARFGLVPAIGAAMPSDRARAPAAAAMGAGRARNGGAGAAEAREGARQLAYWILLIGGIWTTLFVAITIASRWGAG